MRGFIASKHQNLTLRNQSINTTSRVTVKAQLGLQLDYCPCLSVQALRENRLTDSLSDSSPVGGGMCHSAGCNWTYFWLAKQATNKLARG